MADVQTPCISIITNPCHQKKAISVVKNVLEHTKSYCDLNIIFKAVSQNEIGFTCFPSLIKESVLVAQSIMPAAKASLGIYVGEEYILELSGDRKTLWAYPFGHVVACNALGPLTFLPVRRCVPRESCSILDASVTETIAVLRGDTWDPPEDVRKLAELLCGKLLSGLPFTTCLEEYTVH